MFPPDLAMDTLKALGLLLVAGVFLGVVCIARDLAERLRK
jgi:hypothetical protein